MSLLYPSQVFIYPKYAIPVVIKTNPGVSIDKISIDNEDQAQFFMVYNKLNPEQSARQSGFYVDTLVKKMSKYNSGKNGDYVSFLIFMIKTNKSTTIQAFLPSVKVNVSLTDGTTHEIELVFSCKPPRGLVSPEELKLAYNEYLNTAPKLKNFDSLKTAMEKLNSTVSKSRHWKNKKRSIGHVQQMNATTTKKPRIKDIMLQCPPICSNTYFYIMYPAQFNIVHVDDITPPICNLSRVSYISNPDLRQAYEEASVRAKKTQLRINLYKVTDMVEDNNNTLFTVTLKLGNDKHKVVTPVIRQDMDVGEMVEISLKRYGTMTDMRFDELFDSDVVEYPLKLSDEIDIFQGEVISEHGGTDLESLVDAFEQYNDDKNDFNFLDDEE